PVQEQWTRRQWLARATAAAGAGLAAGLSPSRGAEPSPQEPFGYCLNTSTLMGQKLDLVQLVEIVAKAGYQAIEPWVREMDQYVKRGGDLKERGRRLRARGLTVESAIGFFGWVVDDGGKRKKGLEEARRNLDLVQQLGGKRRAAPPVGAQKAE